MDSVPQRPKRTLTQEMEYEILLLEEKLRSMKDHIRSETIDDKAMLFALEKMSKISETLDAAFSDLGFEQKKIKYNSQASKHETTLQNGPEMILKKTTTEETRIALSPVYLHFDGASRGNPGQSGGGFVISKSITPDLQPDEQIYLKAVYLGEKLTNNQAEYMALIAGLNACLERKFTSIVIYGDSMLVIKQLSGEWKVKHENMKELSEKAKALLSKFKKVELHHILREKNSKADELANKGIDLRGS